jgi:hypothetical protein
VSGRESTEALIAFYSARLDEDEAAAKAAAHPSDGRLGPRKQHQPMAGAPYPEGPLRASDGEIVVYDEGRPSDEEFDHIARHDPARVLREVAANRAVAELHNGSHECSTYDHNGDIDNCTWIGGWEACSTLRHLAAVYSDHPDYRPGEWKP